MENLKTMEPMQEALAQYAKVMERGERIACDFVDPMEKLQLAERTVPVSQLLKTCNKRNKKSTKVETPSQRKQRLVELKEKKDMEAAKKKMKLLVRQNKVKTLFKYFEEK